MTNDLKLILLGYVPYSFDDKDGKKVSGCSVWFLEEKPQNDEYGQGFIPKKANMPYEFKNELAGVKFPYLASPQLTTRFTSKGAKAVIGGFDLMKPIDLILSDLNKK